MNTFCRYSSRTAVSSPLVGWTQQVLLGRFPGSCVPLRAMPSAIVRDFHASVTRSNQELLTFIERKPEVAVIANALKTKQFDTGDKEGLPKWDLTALRLEFEGCQELKDADPLVKTLCSLEYGGGPFIRRTLERDLISKVQRYKTDTNSIEARIARLTAQIRTMQVHAKRLHKIRTNIHDGKNISLLLEAAQRRTKYLRRLREWDYNKFCWVLETLNLEYTPNLPCRRTSKKEIYLTLIQKKAMEIRRDKFIKYHEQLKGKQDEFLVRQERELAEIEEEERQIYASLATLKEADEIRSGVAATVAA